MSKSNIELIATAHKGGYLDDFVPFSTMRNGSVEICTYMRYGNKYILSASIVDDKRDGEATLTDDVGNVVSMLTFSMGNLTGPCIIYGNNGKLLFKGALVDGIRNGNGVEYDEQGNEHEVIYRCGRRVIEESEHSILQTTQSARHSHTNKKPSSFRRLINKIRNSWVSVRSKLSIKQRIVACLILLLVGCLCSSLFTMTSLVVRALTSNGRLQVINCTEYYHLIWFVLLAVRDLEFVSGCCSRNNVKDITLRCMYFLCV